MTEKESFEILRAEMDRQGVTDNELRAGIAAIAMGESALQPRSETGYGGTSTARIRAIFGARVSGLSDAQIDVMKKRPEEYFNFVYGGEWGRKNLGNTEPDDGWRYRGRTVLQLTGRSNYVKLQELTGHAIVNDPDLANRPDVSAAIAVGYMRWRYKHGGWPAMKKAVGNNTPDIDKRKNDYFDRFKKSGEFDYQEDAHPEDAPKVEAPPPEDEEVVTAYREASRKLQTFLRDKGFYRGQIDSDFGSASQLALSLYLDGK